MGKYTPEQLNDFSKEQIISLFCTLQDQLDQTNQNLDRLIDQIAGQMSLFNEAEEYADPDIPEPDADKVLIKVIVKKPKQKGKRQEDFKDLPQEEIHHALTDEQLDQYFGKGCWRRMKQEEFTRVRCQPATFTAEKYTVDAAVGTDGDHQDEFLRGDRPKDLLKNSDATPSLVAAILNAKYLNAMPLYRIEQQFEMNGVNISRQNMANWIISSYDRYFSKLIPSFKKELLGSHIIHADETTLRCSKDCKDREKNYMWVYRSSQFLDVNQVVLFDYQKDRKAEHPEEYLKGFKGTLVCDGYSAYKNLNRDIDIAGCWVHAKRKFSDYVKALGEEKAKGTLAHQGVIRISKIFHEEHKLKDLCDKEHLEKRKQIIKPMVDDFFDWIKENKDKVPLKSQTGKAFTYALNQEDYLRTFLSDPNIPLENNAAERAIRPFTVGRKNWVMIDTPKGAKASAAIYSIIETAKMYDLKLYDYIRYLLEELPKYENCQECPEHLLPWSDQLPAELYKSKS